MWMEQPRTPYPGAPPGYEAPPAWQWQPPPQEPPFPPELPPGQDPRPRWPWWYGPVALFGVIFVVLLVGGITAVAVAPDGDVEEIPAELNIVLTLVQDAALIGAAIWFASWVRKPRFWQFGFTSTRLWPAVGWSALAAVCYLIFAGVYGALVAPEEQTTLEDLGVDELSPLLLGFAIIVAAPVVEEVFFRGFLYRAMRSSLAAVPAALVSGVIFGLVHAPTGVEVIPVLAALGVALCLVYERTGSLYPCIFLHTLLNTLAFGAGTDDWVAAGALGVPMLAACVLVPWLVPHRPALSSRP